MGKQVLLAAIGIAMVVSPIGFGMVGKSPKIPMQSVQDNGAIGRLLHASDAGVQPFEVASIRPSKSGDQGASPGGRDRYYLPSLTTRELIKFAYNIKLDDQLSGGPSWINTAKYTINAKIDEATADRLEKFPICWTCVLPKEGLINQYRLMVQMMLADRFKLKVNFVTKELPVYALVVAKGGPRMKEDPVPYGPWVENGISRVGPGQFRGQNSSTGLLALVLQLDPEIDRLVINETGLQGHYDWTLTWTPEQSTSMFKAPNDAPPSGTSQPDEFGLSIFAALEKQLGLKLKQTKGPVETLVIESIERPSEN